MAGEAGTSVRMARVITGWSQGLGLRLFGIIDVTDVQEERREQG